MNPTDKLIFVIEPDEETAQEVVIALAKAGYEVIRTTTAQAAIDQITELELPDLVIYSLPADGSMIIKYLLFLSREAGKTPTIHLPKPLDIQELLRIINNSFIAILI